MNRFLGCLLLIGYRKNNVKYDFDKVRVLNNKIINNYMIKCLEQENNIKIKNCKCFVNYLYKENDSKRLSFIIQTEDDSFYIVCNNNILKYER